MQNHHISLLAAVCIDGCICMNEYVRKIVYFYFNVYMYIFKHVGEHLTLTWLFHALR